MAAFYAKPEMHWMPVTIKTNTFMM